MIHITPEYLDHIRYVSPHEVADSDNSIITRFVWFSTHEGHAYWQRQYETGPDEEAQAKLDEMERVHRSHR